MMHVLVPQRRLTDIEIAFGLFSSDVDMIYGLYDNGPKVLGLFLPFFLGSWGCLGLLLINIEDDYGI